MSEWNCIFLKEMKIFENLTCIFNQENFKEDDTFLSNRFISSYLSRDNYIQFSQNGGPKIFLYTQICSQPSIPHSCPSWFKKWQHPCLSQTPEASLIFHIRSLSNCSYFNFQNIFGLCPPLYIPIV